MDREVFSQKRGTVRSDPGPIGYPDGTGPGFFLGILRRLARIMAVDHWVFYPRDSAFTYSLVRPKGEFGFDQPADAGDPIGFYLAFLSDVSFYPTARVQ